MPDGSIYEGKINSTTLLQHGFGSQIYTDGSKYVGSWKEGRVEGKGKFTYASGNTYEGQVKNGMANGYGVFNHKSGQVFTGMWVNDL